MRLRVLSDPRGRGFDRGRGHDHGPVAPRLVGHRVHVAVVAREVAAAVNLQNEFTERYRPPAARLQGATSRVAGHSMGFDPAAVTCVRLRPTLRKEASNY